MKKLFIALLLLPVFATAQIPDSVQLRSKDLQPAGNKLFTLVPVDDDARAAAQAAKQTADGAVSVNNSQASAINSLTATTNSLTTVVTSQGTAITDLQSQVLGLQIGDKPLPKKIYDNSYTLTEDDNGRVLYVYVTCVITCPTLFEGFSCKIIRRGAPSSAVVTINGAASVYGYKRLTLQNAEAYVDYESNAQPVLTGRLSK